MLNLVIKADTLSLASLDDSQISCVTQREIESIAIDSTSVRISASIGLSVYPPPMMARVEESCLKRQIKKCIR